MAKTETIWAPYTFTEEEAQQNAKDLAQKLMEQEALEDQKKSVVSSFKSKIDMTTAEINDLRNKVASGQEQRSYRCEIKLNAPLKRREYYEMNTGRLMKTEPFKNEDYQQDMFVEDEI